MQGEEPSGRRTAPDAGEAPAAPLGWIALALACAGAAALAMAGFAGLLGIILAAAAVTAIGVALRRALAARTRAPAVPASATPAAPPPVALAVPELFEQLVVILDGAMTVRDFTTPAKALFPALERGRAFGLAVRDPEVLALAERALGGGPELSAPYAELGGQERQFRLRARAGDVRDGAGSEARVLLVFEDVSEQRATERMRADFVANASHELRTPLASLLGFIETLQGPARDDAPARQRFLGVMRDQAGRMARVIEDLLSLSRAEQRVHQAPSGRVDLAEVARVIADLMAPLAREAGVSLEVAVPDGPVTIRGDRDDLMRLGENLIQNAVKYGKDGGRVEILVAREDGRARFSVRDFGRGIAPLHLPRLTERFYRVDPSHSRETGGTGLGLAIVKHIATRHGARLEIASRPGEGARFTVHFPPPEDAGGT